MSSETKIDFDKMDGLVPGIVQDARTGEVLMLGFLNPISYAKTLESGFVTFWSRTRQKLWMKGETSGKMCIRDRYHAGDGPGGGRRHRGHRERAAAHCHGAL